MFYAICADDLYGGQSCHLRVKSIEKKSTLYAIYIYTLNNNRYFKYSRDLLEVFKHTLFLIVLLNNETQCQCLLKGNRV